MKVSIIILSYNTKELLHSCLSSVFNHLTIRPYSHSVEVIVVDNASADDSVKMVKQAFPQVKLIVLPQNVGFAAGNNAGIKKSKGEYVLLLNSDTQITDATFLPVLVDYLDQHAKVGLVTPKVLLPNGNPDPACHRGIPTPWNALTYFSGLEKLFPHHSWFSGYHLTSLDLNTIHQIPATAATAILVRRSAIDQIGLLDEQFFLYGEDLDWCQRLTDAGWQIVYNPTVTILHHKSASGKKKSTDPVASQEASTHFYDTMKLFYEKHYSDRYPKWLRKLIYFGIDIQKRRHR